MRVSESRGVSGHEAAEPKHDVVNPEVAVARQQEAGRALQEDKARLLNILQAVPVGMGVVIQGAFTEVNDHFMEIIGYSRDELLGHSPALLYATAQEAEKEHEKCLEQLEAGDTAGIETEWKCKNGARIDVLRSVALLDPENPNAGFVLTASSTAERQCEREALRHSQMMLSHILNSIPQAVFWKDRESRYLGCNQPFASAVGIADTEQVVGLTDYDLPWRLEDTEAYRADDRSVMESNTPKRHIIEPLQQADGKRLWIDTTKVPLHDSKGNVMGVLGVYDDITDRKQADEALRENEALMKSVFRAAPTGIGVVINRVITEANDRLCEMTGYSREELLGQNSRMLYPTDEDYAYVGKEKYAQIAQRGTGTVETKWRRKDGAIMDILLSSTPIDLTNHAAGVTFTALDITERKRAEEALRVSEERLRAVVSSVPVVMFAIDMEGTFILSEGKGLALLGLKPSEVVGKSVFEAYRDYPVIIESIKRALAGKEHRVEYELSGLVFDTWLAPVMAADGSQIGMMGVAADVTEQKRAEAASRLNEERLQSLHELHHKDFVEEIELIEHALEEAVRLTGSTIGYFHFVAEDQANLQLMTWSSEVKRTCTASAERHYPLSVAGVWADSLRTQKPVVHNDYQGLIEKEGYPEGHSHIVRHASVPVIHDGKVVLISGVGNKATPYDESDVRQLQLFMEGVWRLIVHKRAEEERHALDAKFQQAQKLESLGVLAGGIAHDFNNLLMAILGNADLALQDLSSVSPARPMLEEIERTARRAADLCKQMLAYSGKGRFVVRPINLSELVHEMSHMLDVSISKKASVRYALADPLPSVEADATQMRQIVLNLIVNASEAIGNQSGVVTVSTGTMVCDGNYLRGTLTGDGLPEGRYVYVEVADTGCGMSAETLKRIFDPFFTTKFTGRGLGLAAVLGIVRGHKGTINVYSEPDKGTTFKVLFPALDAPAERIHTGPSPRATWRAKGTILLVDDEEAVRTLATKMLERLGFEVLAAADGREAIEIFKRQSDQITCVLLDLTMPKMDGEEAFRELRRIRSDVRVVMSSGFNEQEIVSRFSGKGLAGFIQKPYRLDELQSTLQRVF